MSILSESAAKPLKVVYILVVTAILLLWLMQSSVNAYWVQTYHRPGPLAELSRFTWWAQGEVTHTAVKQQFSQVTAATQSLFDLLNNYLKTNVVDTAGQVAEAALTEKSSGITDKAKATDTPLPAVVPDKRLSKPSAYKSSAHNPPAHSKQLPVNEHEKKTRAMLAKTQRLYSRTEANHSLNAEGRPSLKVTATTKATATLKPQSGVASIAAKAAANIVTNTAANTTAHTAIAAANKTANPLTSEKYNQPAFLTLRREDKVFFAGDSMMQGIAPHIKYTLSKTYGIKSINLSKQSTGLSYASFFNWPQTVEDTLNQHPDIRLMVMFLGPNDPWAVPNPEGGAYLPFKSARWEAFYRGQIQRILKAAKKHHVQVLWVGVPNMRKNKLNQGIHYLNTLYRSEAQKAGIHYLPTNALFGYDDHRYHKYATTAAGKKIAVRTKDGIHFTRSGQKRIANKILSLIQVQ